MVKGKKRGSTQADMVAGVVADVEKLISLLVYLDLQAAGREQAQSSPFSDTLPPPMPHPLQSHTS